MIERRKNPDRRISPAIGDFALEERAGLLEQIAKRDARIEKLSLSNDELARMLAVVATKLAALKAQQPSAQEWPKQECPVTGAITDVDPADMAGQQPSAGVVDERAAFERHFKSVGSLTVNQLAHARDTDGMPFYEHLPTRIAWSAWQARARLNQPTAGDGVLCALMSALEGVVHDQRVPNEVSQECAAVLIEARRLNPCRRAQAVQVQICKLGMYGTVYDAPDTCRAYTYSAQPGNDIAYRLGDCLRAAHCDGGGDFIDFGLALLRRLQDKGFGVFQIAAAPSANKEPGDE